MLMLPRMVALAPIRTLSFTLGCLSPTSLPVPVHNKCFNVSGYVESPVTMNVIGMGKGGGDQTPPPPTASWGTLRSQDGDNVRTSVSYMRCLKTSIRRQTDSKHAIEELLFVFLVTLVSPQTVLYQQIHLLWLQCSNCFVTSQNQCW